VVLEVPESLPPVRADAGLLERVVANLVDNALRHDPGDIVVRGGVGLVEVVDHGPGLADVTSAFAPFQRLGDRSSGGVGLGLAVARGFVEAMGGTITATTTEGGGLTMRVELPS
jgi:two-component system sensor histidine kinase KdpD